MAHKLLLPVHRQYAYFSVTEIIILKNLELGLCSKIAAWSGLVYIHLVRLNTTGLQEGEGEGEVDGDCVSLLG